MADLDHRMHDENDDDMGYSSDEKDSCKMFDFEGRFAHVL